MTLNNIKTLIQCENEARELIASARKERENLKKRAKNDASYIVQQLSDEREKEIEKFKIENNTKLKQIEAEIEEEYKQKHEFLDGLEIDEMVDIILEMICKVGLN